MLDDEDAADLLAQFPSVEFAFAYGSGVVEQAGYTYEYVDPQNLPMLDAVLVVEDPIAWHSENILLNPSHYSPLIPIPLLGPLGPRFVAYFQSIPAHLWFNTYVPIPKGRYIHMHSAYIHTQLHTHTVTYTQYLLHIPITHTHTHTHTPPPPPPHIPPPTPPPHTHHHVPLRRYTGRMMKYGVISKRDLLEDLTSW
jgi:hypothetical protein